MTSIETPSRPDDWNRSLTVPIDLGLAALGFVVSVLVGVVAVLAPLYVVVGVVLLVGFSAALRRPTLATLLVIVLLYSNAAVVAVRIHGAPFVLGAGAPLLLILPLAYHIVVQHEPVILSKYFVPIGVLIAVNIAATLNADPGGDATIFLLTFAVEGVGLFLLLLNVVRSFDQLQAVLAALVIAAGLIGALSVFQQATSTFNNNYGGFAQVNESIVELSALDYALNDPEDLPSGQPRLAGPIGEKNFYAYVLLFVWPVAVYLARFHPRSSIRVASLISVVTISGGALLTFSRGAAVGFAVTATVLALIGILDRRIVFGVIALTLVAILATPTYRERLTTLVNAANVTDARASSASEADTALRGRYSEMVSAAYVFADNPLLGVGPGQFRQYYLEYSERLGLGGLHDEPREAHNLYLGIAAELGIFGLAAFLSLQFMLMRDLYPCARSFVGEKIGALSSALLMSFGIFSVSGLFLHMAFVRYAWMLLALTAVFLGLVRSAPSPVTGSPVPTSGATSR